MRQITIVRNSPLKTDADNFGDWISDSGWRCRTGELPWHDNRADISCIPPGKYTGKWLWSEKHQANLYHLIDVPGRSNCEIHSANVPTLQLLGCICPGEEVSVFTKGSVISHLLPPLEHDFMGVTASMTMLALLEKDLRDQKTGEQQDFELTVR